MNPAIRYLRKRRVLRWVNEQRVKYKLDGEVGPAGTPLKTLPKGRKDHTRECPIARALDGKAGIFATYAGPHLLWHISHPVFVRHFIGDFDNGEYPELVISSKEGR